MPHDALTRLVSSLHGVGRRRIRLDLLKDAFAEACPELAEQPDRRNHLAALIERAAGQGVMMLPRGQRSWDRIGGSPLPSFVVLSLPEARQSTVVAPGYAWHPLLAFAADERHPMRLASLKLINEWLKTDPSLSIIVPIKERSLEIFGDEKRLDQLRSGKVALFDGKLTLPALGCRVCPIPLPYEPGPDTAHGKPVLILENNDTWWSFCNWNRGSSQFSAVAYAGGGNAKGLAYDETFLDELLDRYETSELLYFGDLDPAGVRIAAGAARRRAARGCSPLSPAAPLYDWLLVHGRPAPMHSREQLTIEDLTWLHESARPAIARLFASGRRIPQEALGLRALASGAVKL